MRLPRVPNFRKLVAQTDLSRIIELIEQPHIREFVAQANSEYYHWEKFRRRPLPPALSVEHAWIAVKLGRVANQRLAAMQDVNGTPFRWSLPDTAQRYLHLVDRNAGDLLSVDATSKSEIDKWKQRILVDSHMEEAIATSQIEGAVTTRMKAKEMLRAGRKPRDRSEQMIANGFRTIRLLAEQAREPLTFDLLHRIQQAMTEGTLDRPEHAGTFRDSNDEQIHVVDVRDEEIVYTPPPADQVVSRMEKLLAFANEPDSDANFMHPLVKASILHFWLAYEHPYNDGNGRTARALFYWYMLKRGYWLFEFLTISRVINAARMKYYRAFLYTETDENDLTYFIAYMLRTTWNAIEDLRSRIGEMSSQEQRMRQIVAVGIFNHRQRAVLDHALRHSSAIFTFESHRVAHGISQVTARQDVLGLFDRGLLIEVGGERPREFAPAPDLLTRIQTDRTR